MMRKYTLAMTMLVGALSIATLVPAYADDTMPQEPAAASDSSGCSSCSGCKSTEDAAPPTTNMNTPPSPGNDATQ